MTIYKKEYNGVQGWTRSGRRRMIKNTVFDDVFRTMVQKMPQLLIPLVNEVFHTDYKKEEELLQLRNEYEEKLGKIVSDSIVAIGNKTYHIECQSVDDTTMTVRMVEYDFAIALEGARKNGRIYEVDFPNSCVLYLRCSKATPERLEVKVNFPNGDSFVYESKVIKVQNYTSDEILEKKLLILLPYYIMRYEKDLKEIGKDEERQSSLLKEYEKIRGYLEEEFLKKNPSILYMDLVKLIVKISDYVLRKEKKLREGVGDIMGGKVLELESERLIRIGKVQGRIEGKAEGKVEGKVEGKAEGKIEGENLLGNLIMKLLGEGRTADVELAAKDKEARKKFYQEFGLID